MSPCTTEFRVIDWPTSKTTFEGLTIAFTAPIVLVLLDIEVACALIIIAAPKNIDRIYNSMGILFIPTMLVENRTQADWLTHNKMGLQLRHSSGFSPLFPDTGWN